jgi:predicted CXXCH cytochrome family protein
MAATDCGSCHDPHGSKSMPLIARGSIHPPFRDGCSNCHDGSAEVLQGGGGNDLCTVCHDDVAEAAAAAEVPHPAMEMIECIDCHSPHASRQPDLLRVAGGGVCLTCHEDQGGAAGDTVHGAIDWIGCQSCHVPHGGDGEKLLREHGNELCNGCHLQREVVFDQDGGARLKGGYELNAERADELGIIELDTTRQKDHPIPDHPVAGLISGRGRTEVAPSLVGEEMSCRLCHEPHAAPSAQLFAWQATTQTELCLACHPK